MRVLVVVLVLWSVVSIAAALALGAFIRAARRAPVVREARRPQATAPGPVRPTFERPPAVRRRTVH
jgi:hypothetical protein